MIAPSRSPGFRLGISFHSFTEEYCSLKWSFEDMLELSVHLGGGIEIVGPAHHRGFPNVVPEFVRSFRSGVERYGLTPVCYGSYADPFQRADRDMNDDELVDYTLPQLRTAAALGFPIVRLQYFTHRVIERVLPLANRLGLKLGYELHAPLAFESDATRQLMEQVRRIASPNLGIIPDCGIFGRSVPAFKVADAKARGASDAVLARALELWRQQQPLGSALDELKSIGLSQTAEGGVESFWGSISQSDPDLLLEHMDHIIHMHGKYFSIENDDEPDLRYRDVVSALVRGGYRGWMMTEYEGAGGGSTFHLVHAHQRMVQRHMDEAISAMAGSRRDLLRIGLGGAALLAASSLWGRIGAAAPIAGAELRFADVVSDLTIPATDIPGARAAGVAQFLLLAVAHNTLGARGHELDQLYRELNARAGGDFLALPPKRRQAVLAAHDAASFGPHGKPGVAWPVVKAIILAGYYSSEIGGSHDQRYDLIPGRFDADIAYRPGDPALSNDWAGNAFR